MNIYNHKQIDVDRSVRILSVAVLHLEFVVSSDCKIFDVILCEVIYTYISLNCIN